MHNVNMNSYLNILMLLIILKIFWHHYAHKMHKSDTANRQFRSKYFSSSLSVHCIILIMIHVFAPTSPSIFTVFYYYLSHAYLANCRVICMIRSVDYHNLHFRFQTLAFIAPERAINWPYKSHWWLPAGFKACKDYADRIIMWLDILDHDIFALKHNSVYCHLHVLSNVIHQ